MYVTYECSGTFYDRLRGQGIITVLHPDNQQSTMESTTAGQETGEAGSTTRCTEESEGRCESVTECKKAVTDALGDNYWPGFEIPGKC